MKDQHFRSMDDLIASISGMSIEELANEPTEHGRHLITVDELRAAGALDVPPEWRKHLGGKRVERVERDLFSDLADDDTPNEKQPPTAPDVVGDASDDDDEIT